MNACETYQAQLLDHLYGLLDEQDGASLTGHLASCEACRAALAAAESHRQVLSAAAKGHFPGIRFEPPATAGRLPDARRVAPRPARRWGRWAIAAAILCLLAGGATLGAFSWYRHYEDCKLALANYHDLQNQRAGLQRKQQGEAERAALEIRAVQEQIKELEAKWDGELAKTQKDLGDKQLQVLITGPRDVQAGARNEYQIDTRRLVRQGARLATGASTPTEVRARVVDQQGKIVYEQTLKNPGQCQLVLPRDLPLKPGTQLALEVSARDAAGAQAELTEQLPLAGAVYLTHLTTDRPMYRPGEVVRYRSLTLDRFTLKPAEENFQLQYTISDTHGQVLHSAAGSAQLTEPNAKDKAPLHGPDGKVLRGLGAGEFRLPPHVSGGEYTLTVKDAQNRFPQERRKFLVQQYQAPRLNKELEFTRKSYGPGDTVEAVGKVARVEGGKAVAGQPVIPTILLDGRNDIGLDNPQNLVTDADGKVRLRFTLPRQIERGAGSLSLQFTDGANVETIVRPIPIVLKKLLLDFYPEGGELVAGVPNRVYFQARSTLGKPAELRGRVVDQDGKEVGRVQTLNDDHEPGVNQGMGRFELAPAAGKSYELKIEAPIGIEGRYALPAVKADGVALSTPEGVIGDKIEVLLHSGQTERRLLVGAYCRGRLLDHARIQAKPGEPVRITLKTAEAVSGVHRVTVFEEQQGDGKVQLLPVAERLVYRRPVEKLNLTVRPGRPAYAPGGHVTLSLGAADEKDRPVSAIAVVSVVDQSVRKLVDDKTARSMPTHFLLTTEVQRPEELEYADFLVSGHPKAAAALDLLLGTQGWRRFAEQNPDAFRKGRPADADRLLLASGQSQGVRADFLKLELSKVDKQFAPAYEEKQKELARAEAVEDRTRADTIAESQRYEAAVQNATNRVGTTRMALEDHTSWLVQLAAAVVITALLIFGFSALLLGMLRASQGRRGAAPRILVGLCSLSVLFLGGAAVVFYYVGNFHQNERWGRGAPMAVAKAAPAAGPVAADAPAADMEPAVNLGIEGAEMADWGKAGDKNFPAPKNAPQMPPGQNELLRDPKLVKKAGAFAPEDNKAMKANLDDKEEKEKKPAMFDQVAKDKDAAGGAGPMAPPMAGGIAGQPGPQNFAANLREFGMPQQPFFAERDRLLRKQGAFKDLAARRMGGVSEAPQPPQPFLVRVYAHAHQTSPDGVRRDFTETVYWHPVLVLADGKGQVEFDLSDAVTRYDVQVWAHGLDGRLGAVTTELTARLPYSVEPKVPFEVTSTDKIIIPVTVANDTQRACSVELKAGAANLELQDDADRHFVLSGDKRGRQLFHFQPSCVEGEAKVRFRGSFAVQGQANVPGARLPGDPAASTDAVERTFKVVPEGFPVVGSHSDLLEKTAQHEVVLPAGWVNGTLQLKAQVFPSTLADLQKGLESLLREPCGCFEQSSTSNYPNVLILNYLKESDQAKPEVEQRARQLLSSGYSKLLSFECIDQPDRNKRGYEWFGGAAPPHEALTAYGLLQFRDMARVHPVDPAMLERTQKYLLGQRDGKGSFKKNARALDTFGRAPQDVTDAYIVWALTESGVEANLDTELNALAEKAKTSKDPYFLALVGNSLVNRGRGADGVAVLKTLAGLQKDDGRLTGAQTSITSSGGRDLEIETTALATLAWLKANRPGDFNAPVQKAVHWIGKQRGGYGGFGSTQSTILALKAVIAFTHENRKTTEAGELRLYVGDAAEPAARKEFAAGTLEPLVVTLPQEGLLKAGKNKVRVEITGKNSFPYTLSWSYQTLKPANAEGCPVHLETKLDRAAAAEGDTVRLTATVHNRSGKGQGMAVAILGLPAGLTLPEDMKQLKDMARLQDDGTKPGLISAWEVRGRELVLYWRQLAPDQKIEVPIDLICRIPGEYRGPASRAYLYYNSDLKFWTEPLTVAIAAQGE